jgi:hypothetical protein
MSTGSPSVAPRLIRPSKDGQEGEWSYLYRVHGHDYIFPALVNELGHLKALLGEDEPVQQDHPLTVGPDALVQKVIYWKASEWETKILPHAVAWMDAHKFTLPDLPYPWMELRKIEDRDGDERVTEVVNVLACPVNENHPHPELIVHQFTEVGEEEGKGRRPLLQWWMEGLIELKGETVDARCLSVPKAGRWLGGFRDIHEFLDRKIEESGPGQFFKAAATGGTRGPAISEEELRVIVLFVAFCRYIASLKTTYEEGLPQQGRRRSAPKTTEEALALEQAEIFKTVAVLKSGVRKKPVATGTGTQHRYRYLVRGHERIINGKSIWIKPQIRGQGEFLNRATGTEEAKVAADVIEPPAAVTVQAEAPVSTETPPVVEAAPAEPAATAMPDETPAAPVEQPDPADRVQPPPQPDPPRRKPSLVRSAVRLVLSFFRSRFHP